ncbi:2-dehydropantoate 2-reductase [Rhodoblastus acidophilus]|uniref:2-dehydropantoate 2-reductase n=1 Tax=Rhodoblastus acidophilus TaxID=1074 RepID=UPI002224ED70|nr:2-dehydropantoate 2-reductase [Rhodoblastus acidophilus]MCW2284072.1 2-dehydropantoate 2-reductase [Rhodoblastus acidophilus]MCW2332768.1 2-dehydropantoate 2-reductase [Rhodoblastus acidophilus]
MRILVVGAGALGGYFGGRLAQAGRDVTFLVRPRRAELLSRNGLSILSPHGDFHLAQPRIVTADGLNDAFDLVLLSCKAYDLDDAMDAFAAGVGPHTAILPMLNGMSHIDALAARFGANTCLGGLCQISAGLDGEGRIHHFNDLHALVFGELDGAATARMAAISAALGEAGFDAQPCEKIRQEMWEKWIFIAALAGITCVMRAAVGDIVAAGGGDLALALFDENAAIAAANGFSPRPQMVERFKAILTAQGSPIKASMLRDIEANHLIEGEHIFGDLLRRAPGEAPLLRIAHLHSKAYEAQRARVSA